MQCDLANPIFGVCAFNVINSNVSRGFRRCGSDKVECNTSAGHRLSEGTLDTSGAGHEEEEDGVGFGHQQVRSDVGRHIKGKNVCRFCENAGVDSELTKKAYTTQAKGTCVDRDQRQSEPIKEQATRGDEDVLRASRRSNQDELE